MWLWKFIFGLVWSLAVMNDKCQSLKDVRLSVPPAIRKGETAVLLCDFDLEGDSLYTVKWYKGRKEFYRYTPKDEYPIKTFQIDKIAINVDTSKSNMTQLTLIKVDPSISGIYNCEVSAESPSFHTAVVSGEMDVVEIPYQDPVIKGLKAKYKVGEELEADCTSGGSKPAANITWFLNDEPANHNYVFNLSDIPDNRNPNLLMARSKLEFTVTTHSFRMGRLKIRCSAHIHHIYRRSTERVVDEERLRYIPDGNIDTNVLPPKHLDDEAAGNRLDLVTSIFASSSSSRISHTNALFAVLLFYIGS